VVSPQEGIALNAEHQLEFIDFSVFPVGGMVKECAGCAGIMSRQTIRIFADIHVVVDVAVCERCGEVWLGGLR